MARAPPPAAFDFDFAFAFDVVFVLPLPCLRGRGARATRSAFYSRQASNAIVAIATSAVAIRYACDLTQLASESDNSPNMSGVSAVAAASGVAASQSRHSLRPSDTGKPQVSHRRRFPKAMVVPGVDGSASIGCG